MPTEAPAPSPIRAILGLALLLAPTLAQTQSGLVVVPLHDRPPQARRLHLDLVADPPLRATTDVVLTDNGARIPPEQLQLTSPRDGSDAPVQVLVVIDAINGTEQDVTRSEGAILDFLKHAQSPLPQSTSIVVLSDVAATPTYPARSKGETATLRPHQLFVHRIPPTTNAGELTSALNSYRLGLHRILQPQGGPGQAERVHLSLEAVSFLAQAEAAQPGPKVVVWLSPGWPFLARSDASSSDQLFDSVRYFSDLLRSSRMLLSLINPQGVTAQDHSGQTEAFLLSSRPGSIQANGHAPSIPVESSDDVYKLFLASPRIPSEANPNDLTLQVMAVQSGGKVLQHRNDLRAQLEQCIADASHISTLSYDPLPAQPTVTFHALAAKRLSTSEPLRLAAGFYTR